jgi:hypothetical protein
MTTSPNRSGQIHPVLAVAIGVVAVVGLVAAVLVSRPTGGAPDASDRPSTPPSAAPSAPADDPTPVPTPVVTPAPTPSAAPSAGLGTIELENATNHEVLAQIHDQTGTVERAVSGKPGDGMSVRWHKAIVRNTDADQISITWVGLPQDDTLDIGVAVVDGQLNVTIVQAGPVANSDAMGEDRVVVLTFDTQVNAEDLYVEILDRTID